MELAGEVVTGCFFNRISGLQFISPAALGQLQEGLDEDRVYWINATDPASLCGLGLPELELPRRVRSNHLVFHGSRLVMVSMRQGKSIDFHVEPESPHLPAYLEVLKSLLTREAEPMRGINVEEINGEPAIRSPFVESFQAVFHTVRDHRSVQLSKRYGKNG